MRYTDSRRLTGPNLWIPGPGAALELVTNDPERDAAGWCRHAGALLEGVGWSGETVFTRPYPGGATVGISAPLDALHSAAELCEVAASLGSDDASTGEIAHHAELLRARILREQHELEGLTQLCLAARDHGVACLVDDRLVSVGMGRGRRVFSADRLPNPDALPWAAISDVPVALVTGTNGKTTTVRLLARLLETAGFCTGRTTTDGVHVGAEPLERGDFSGPEGGRLVLRDPRVEAAVLEVARGGILRRGLPVERAHVAIVTNIAEDHLGQYGIHSLEDLADAKLVVHRALPHGPLVLNSEDELLVARGSHLPCPIWWFGSTRTAFLEAQCRAGYACSFVEDGWLCLATGQGSVEPVLKVSEVPITLGGKAAYNVANALAAMLGAHALGVSHAAIGEGLRGFLPEHNPGRAGVFPYRGARVVVDYAHNSHGARALAHTLADAPETRRVLLISQAGDRSEKEMSDMVVALMALRPTLVIVAELPGYERGRAEGETSRILRNAFHASGVPEHALTCVRDPTTGTQHALERLAPGDLAILCIHGNRDDALALIKAG